MEKVTEKFEMGLDAQKRFAQMYEDRHMHKRIGSKMVKLDSIIIEKSRKEIRAGKTKPPLKIRNKSNDLAVGIWGRKNKNFLPHKPGLLQL